MKRKAVRSESNQRWMEEATWMPAALVRVTYSWRLAKMTSPWEPRAWQCWERTTGRPRRCAEGSVHDAVGGEEDGLVAEGHGEELGHDVLVDEPDGGGEAGGGHAGVHFGYVGGDDGGGGLAGLF